MRTEDGHIIHKCFSGETEAFGFLVDKYRESVYAFAYSKLRNFEDAEDVTQEVFFKAYKNLRTLKRWDSFLGWLYSITSNLCKNWIRAQSRRPDGEFTEDKDRKTLEIPAIDAYRDRMARESLRESLDEALDALPEAYRLVLTLHYLGGLSNREIARFLGTSPAAVKQRLMRARTQMKEEMLAMMSATYRTQKLPVGFTFHIVEAIKRMKIQPVPRTAGLPWGLSLAAGIIIAILSIGSHLNLPDLFPPPVSTAQSYEAEMAEFGKMPVEILRMSRMPFPFGRQGNSYGSGFQLPNQQNAVLMAPRGEGGEFPEEPFARFGKGTIGNITYSPDGKLLAAAGGLGIWLYDASNLEEIELMREDPYRFAAFSPDGKLLAVAGAENQIYFWDVSKREQIGALKGHTDIIYCIAFSPDGEILASGSYDKLIHLWDVREQKQIGVLQGHTEPARSIVFSPDGKTLASCDGWGDKAVHLWDIQEQKHLGLLQGHTEGVQSVAFNPEGNVLASAGEAIRLWNVQEQKQIGLLQGNATIGSVAFSPDGEVLASGSLQTIDLWNVQEQKLVSSLQGFEDWASSVVFSPDGKMLAAMDGRERIRLWDVQEQRQAGIVDGFTIPTGALAFSPDGKVLVSGSGDLRLWSVQEQRQIGVLPEFYGWTGSNTIVFTPDGKLIASVGWDFIIKLWHVQEQKQVGEFKGHTDQIRSIAFSPDGKTLLSSSLDYTVRLWDVAEQKEIGVLRNGSHAHGVAISPDGEVIAAAIGGECLIRLWDAQTLEQIGILKEPRAAMTISYSPDSKTIASGNNGGLIRLWDAESQKHIGDLRGCTADDYAYTSFSPDGRWLASVGTDGIARIWDVQEQKQIFEIEEHYQVKAIAFSPDGKWFASAGSEGNILLWEVNLTVPGISIEPTGKLPGTWGGMKKTELLQNYPNPFNPETWIPYSLSKTEHVTIKIYSTTGQLVRTLDLGQRASGEYLSRDKAAHWDGRNEAGEAVASNIYFCVMEAGEFTDSRKIVVAR